MNNKRDWEVFIYNYPTDQLPKDIKASNFKAVALCMAYHTEWKTLSGMSVSNLTIASETGLHRNTVNKIIAAMNDMGLLNQKGKRVWSQTGKWTYVYDLHIPDAQIDVHPSDEQANDTDAQIDVHPLMTDAHFEGTDAHFEGTDAQIDVHNNTYNHTNNQKDNHIDEPASAVSKQFDNFQPEKSIPLADNIEVPLADEVDTSSADEVPLVDGVEAPVVKESEVPVESIVEEAPLAKESKVPDFEEEDEVETDVSVVSNTDAAENEKEEDMNNTNRAPVPTNRAAEIEAKRKAAPTCVCGEVKAYNRVDDRYDCLNLPKVCDESVYKEKEKLA